MAATSKDIIEIVDIKDNTVLLKNGSLRLVMEISAINFELRSEQEQAAIIQSFQNFLNSIDFPIQIVVGSLRYNIDDYIASVQASTSALTNELLRLQAEEYMKFVKELSTLANIMSKKFYIVVPFYVVETVDRGGILGSITGIFKSAKSISGISPEKFAAYQNQLVQRAELIYDSLVGSGLHARIIERDELMSVYNQLYTGSTITQTHGQ